MDISADSKNGWLKGKGRLSMIVPSDTGGTALLNIQDVEIRYQKESQLSTPRNAISGQIFGVQAYQPSQSFRACYGIILCLHTSGSI